ncbi:MAG: TonB-dependent receptor [Verrucomicrobia bacterium]|nr:TonB-dependent receptor [Verrucomicrobiota bacterium]
MQITLRLPLRWVALVLLGFSLCSPMIAAAADTGTITGRVLNPATGEYVRNAEVTARNGALIAITDENGAYTLTDVPPGEVTVEVAYTGARKSTAVLTLAAGQTVSRDFELTSSLAGAPTAAEVVKLGAFVVASEREGNAKAIMEQKNSMNITNSVASDVFGDVAEGNAAEFLKNIPGVDLFLVQGEIVNVRLRGLGAEYNSVTIDGVRLASADANKGAAGDARAFSFEQASLNSMDAIEVSKTISADVDANAPAGTINLRTKRAFSRPGRRVSWQANTTIFRNAWILGDGYGPDDAKHRKVRPGGILEYSDVFLNKRLGVVLNISESNLYSENARTNVTYNYTTTTTDPRPVVPTTIGLYQSPRLNRRSTVTFTSDFKATPNLVLSLGLIYNAAQLYNTQRTFSFGATNRAAVVGADPLAAFTASGTITTNPAAVVKPGEAYTVLPKFEWKRGGLTVEGKLVGSISTSWYNPFAWQGSARNAGSPQLAGVSVRAAHLTSIGGDWQLQQTAGPDLSDGRGFTNRELSMNDGRFGRTKVFSGDLAATWTTRLGLPIAWKTGAKKQQERRDFMDQSNARLYTYIGPGAGTGIWNNYASAYAFEGSAVNSSLLSSSGRGVFIPSLLAIGQLFREHPEYFQDRITNGSTAGARYQSAFVANTRRYQEELTAGFLMGTTSLGKATLRAGLRWEQTDTDSLDFDPRSAAELRAAGYAVTASTGIAATIPGVQYQYFSQPKVHHQGSYENFFPSASFKYRLTRNLDWQLGYSKTIRRPTFRDIAGVWSIDDANQQISAPNANLKPERSDNLATRLAYYFEPVGIVALNLFQNTVKGAFRTDQLTAVEFGNADPEYAQYTFVTTTPSDNEVRIRGLEIEYSQSLSFLPGALRGLNARLSYTRNYATVTTANMSPHGVNAGLSWSYRRLSLYSSAAWRDYVPLNSTNSSFNRHRMPIDVGGNIKFSRRLEFFFTGRNIRSEPVITMQRSGSNPAVPTTYEVTGAVWTFGVKGVW